MTCDPALEPNILDMNSAASSRLDERMTSFGTAAKKAMFTSMYSTETASNANGAALLTVLIGSLTSERA